MSGRPTQQQVAGWADEVEAVVERIGRQFTRSDPRRREVGCVRGLLSDAERKNGWQLAEHLGEATPTGCNTCSPAPTGMPTPSAMTWDGTCTSTWAMRPAC